MFLLNEKLFSGPLKVFQVPMSWFRGVSAFLNNFIGGAGLKLSKPTTPSPDAPVEMSLDEEFVKDLAREAHDPDKLGQGTGANATPTTQAEPAMADQFAELAGIAAFSGIAKDTKTWTADSGHPLEVVLFTRVFRSTGSGRALMGRTFRFSPNGRLMSVSAENVAYRFQGS